VNCKIKKFIYFFFIICFIFVFCFLVKNNKNHFQQIDSYRSVKNVFDVCGQNILVTFDVDDTLITTSNYLANDLDYSTWFKICVAFKYPELLFNKEKFEWLYGLVCKEANRFVFDPDIVSFISQIQRQGCKVVALTSMESGALGVIESMPKWRANMLKDFGIDFGEQFQNISFTTLSLHRGSYPCIYNGILCANQEAKGKVLGAFLDYFQLKPVKIISFDDQERALNSIKSECEKRKINFTGYQVLGAKKLHNSWNMKKAFKQLDFVMQKGQLLSNEQAVAF